MNAAKNFLRIVFLITSHFVSSQNYPLFGPEIKVTINGLSFDAMEPFISTDGNTLFFNSLNSADTTNLYYALKVNDSTFNFAGEVGGTIDSSPNHLDAVASIDMGSNFFWTSLRNFPAQTETIYRGVYSVGNVNNISKVYGTFNIYQPGWLVFDAAINFQGDRLYYSNAFFNPMDCGVVPCIAKLGVAQKVNDTIFDKLANSDLIFSNINDTNYIIYAPQVSVDGLELFYTRLLKGSNNTEICVSVRNSVGDVFSTPSIIHSNPGFTPEAATPTSDKQKIYYHQRNSSSIYEIFLRYRTGYAGINENPKVQNLFVFPNPSVSIIEMKLPIPNQQFQIEIYSLKGPKIYESTEKTQIDISKFPKGMYIINLYQDEKKWTSKIIKE